MWGYHVHAHSCNWQAFGPAFPSLLVLAPSTVLAAACPQCRAEDSYLSPPSSREGFPPFFLSSPGCPEEGLPAPYQLSTTLVGWAVLVGMPFFVSFWFFSLRLAFGVELEMHVKGVVSLSTGTVAFCLLPKFFGNWYVQLMTCLGPGQLTLSSIEVDAS